MASVGLVWVLLLPVWLVGVTEHIHEYMRIGGRAEILCPKDGECVVSYKGGMKSVMEINIQQKKAKREYTRDTNVDRRSFSDHISTGQTTHPRDHHHEQYIQLTHI